MATADGKEPKINDSVCTEEEFILKQIDAGIRVAIADAIEEHRKAGRPIAIWRDGKVVIVPADEIKPLKR